MHGDFDIYRAESGYVAVANEVRRRILQALARKDRELPELVKITGRAKPTLSSVHVRELLAQGLVEEAPHPTDRRRKVYRLKALRVGTSNVPEDQLRAAVREYAARALPPVSLAAALDAIADAPADADAAVLARQARRLGALAAPLFPDAPPREAVTAFAAVLEREGLARPLRLDLEARTLEVELSPLLAPRAPEGRLALLVGAFAEGVAAGKGMEAPTAAAPAGSRRVTLALGAQPAQR